jgi:hypothetical protein
MLKVVGTYDSTELPCVVEVDFYVPITFQTYLIVIGEGARYVHLGVRPAHLLELIVPPASMLLRGFTVTSVDATHTEPLSGSGPILSGLPILELTPGEKFQGRETSQYVKLPIGFSVLLGVNYAEARFGNAKVFDRILAHSSVQFLIHNNDLVGLRVTQLSQTDIETLREYFARKGLC